MKRMLRLLAGCFAVIWFGCPAMVFGAAAVKDVLDRPATKVVNPVHTVLIDVTRAGRRLVAVGERGIIIFSDDAGDSWHQADVPVSTSLTTVDFPTPEKGWAAGHGGVILHTADGGKSWQLQLDGLEAADMALETAQKAAARSKTQDKAAAHMVRNAELLVSDGADKPFLDLYFKNAREGMVVGAYGLIFRTTDGGKSWQCLMDRVENPRGLHLYAIESFKENLYIAGEQGLFLSSVDKDTSFRQLPTPYSGTYFDLMVTASGNIVIVGLRGNAFWSSDQGLTFNRTNVPMEVSFTAAGRLEDGTLMFANQAGMLLTSRDDGRTMQRAGAERLAPISAFIPTDNGSLITVGYGGAIRVQLPSTESTNQGSQQ